MMQKNGEGDTVRRVALSLVESFAEQTRVMVAVAGPPGSGKSTLADLLRDELIGLGQSAVVLPMDGFHMDDGLLRARGLIARKGAPDTFDVRGLYDVLSAVRKAEEEVLLPVFDRAREISLCAARAVSPLDRFVICEGNYLLYDVAPWNRLAPLFDTSLMIAPPVEVLEQRLLARWAHYGFAPEAARAKVEDNDLPNGRDVLARSRKADVTLDVF